MDPITVEAFNQRVRAITHDELDANGDSGRWSKAELLNWLNDAQLAVAFYLPEASSKVMDVPIPGSGNNHLLDDDVIRLLSVVCNILIRSEGGEANTTYNALDLADRQMLATAQPDWNTTGRRARHYIDTPGPLIEPNKNYIINYTQYLYDERTPKQYWLIADPQSPIEIGEEELGAPGGYPQPGLRVTVSVEPLKIEAVDESKITIPNIYLNPLLNFVLHRCYLKEAPFANTREWADYYYDLFRREVVDKHDVNNPLTPYWDRSRRQGARPPNADRQQGQEG